MAPIVGGEFNFLKKKYQVLEGGIICRPDPIHIKKLVELVLSGRWRMRKVPCEKGVTDVDNSSLLDAASASEYRQAVGRLLYLNPERPDIQFTVSCLASKMSAPTKSSWSHLKRLVEYLAATEDYGLMLEPNRSDKSFLYSRGSFGNIWDACEKDLRVLELQSFSDADWAGNKEHRRSTTCCQSFLEGCLVYSYSRTQKSITLSSAEAEYVAMLGSCCESLLIRDAVKWLLDEVVTITDSSSARSLACRKGVGRTRHLQAGFLWLQKRQSRVRFQ